MSTKRGDIVTNCTPDNPLCIINRGPIKVRVLYEDIKEKNSAYFVELRVGNRRQRTALTEAIDHYTMLRDVLSLLGFDPEVETGPINWDESYD